VTDIVLRAAAEQDAPAVAAIYAHYVEHSVATFDVAPLPERTWAERIEAASGARLPFLIAERADDGVHGFAYLSAFRPKPAYRHTLEDTVYLAPDHVGVGTGRLLLTELLGRAAETGAHQLVAVISTGEDGPSARLHRSLGFETVGRLREVGRKFDRWIDVVMMQRAVQPTGEASDATAFRAL
jgi:phosphinothricin acetyltransferase